MINISRDEKKRLEDLAEADECDYPRDANVIFLSGLLLRVINEMDRQEDEEIARLI